MKLKHPEAATTTKKYQAMFGNFLLKKHPEIQSVQLYDCESETLFGEFKNSILVHIKIIIH